jgi:hypothetical protein
MGDEAGKRPSQMLTGTRAVGDIDVRAPGGVRAIDVFATSTSILTSPARLFCCGDGGGAHPSKR